MFNPGQYRSDFPILSRPIHENKKLVYLDNAATSQKPNQVIDAISDYYRNHNANVHRGVHQLGDESTKLFHHSRQTVAQFLGAQKAELIIVRNTTEALNQVAYTWAESHLHEGEVILTTEMEHHSNIVPWQELAHRKKATLEFVEVNEDGRLSLEDLHIKLKKLPVQIVALTHVSNTLGTLNPIEKIVKMIRQSRPTAKIVVDGAQGAAHLPIHFQKLNVDFYAVSAHKMLGPMGIGALLVKKDIVETLPPFLFGGGMINEVSCEKTTYADDLEERFTAGTPDVASLVGWATACEYLKTIGMSTLAAYDAELIRYTLEKLRQFPQVKVIGPQTLLPGESGLDRVGSIAFVYAGVHAHDVGQILDSEGVAVRSGHHCTMPLHTKFNWAATIRVSFQLYNTLEEIDQLCLALQKVTKIFGK
jgi:cysteine desulfurase/selenocysteine lyase